MTKKEIRRVALARRRALSPDLAAAWSRAACARLSSMPEFERASALLSYVAAKDNELDTGPLLRSMLAAGRTVLIPVVRGPDEMLWSRLESWDDLAPGRFGLLEPRADRLRPCAAPAGALCVVPGIAFTRGGARIGYGGGYFDRFLAGFEGFTAGLAYEMQLYPDLPAEKHDIPLHAVVTETGLYRSAT